MPKQQVIIEVNGGVVGIHTDADIDVVIVDHDPLDSGHGQFARFVDRRGTPHEALVYRMQPVKDHLFNLERIAPIHSTHP